MSNLSDYKLTITANADITLGNITTANITTSNVQIGDVTISKERDYYHGGNGLSVGSVVTNNYVVITPQTT
jgi:hypothetical protein